MVTSLVPSLVTDATFTCFIALTEVGGGSDDVILSVNRGTAPSIRSTAFGSPGNGYATSTPDATCSRRIAAARCRERSCILELDLGGRRQKFLPKLNIVLVARAVMLPLEHLFD